MRYEAIGRLPRKRHVQVREDGRLLVEEVMGYEGFSGNESILYHLHSPCRLDGVGAFTPLLRDEWVPKTHVHRLADINPVPPGGDPLSGRRLLMFNGDLEVLGLQADLAVRRLLSQRSGRRGDLRASRPQARCALSLGACPSESRTTS